MTEASRCPAQGDSTPDRSQQHTSRVQAVMPWLVSAVTLVGLMLVMRGWGFDDPYVTFRFTDNLLAGRGLAYNAGERMLSTVSPLYAALLALLGLVWHDVPRVSNVIGILSTVASAAVLMMWSRPGQRAAGMIAGLLLSVWPLVLQTTGLERSLFMLLLLVGFCGVERSRLMLAAGALALLGMLRPEGLLAGAVAGAAILVRRRSIPWQAVLLYVVPVGLWYGAQWLYFGSPLPTNLAAKQQQARMPGGVGFAGGFLQLLRQYGRHPLYWLHGALALIGLGRVATRARHWGLLLIWTVLYFLGYWLLGVGRYFWFYVPLVPALLVLVAEGAVSLFRGLARLRVPRTLVEGLAGLVVVCLLAPPLTGTLTNAWRTDPRLEVYGEIGHWLRAETPSDATVGALEVGIMGYYSQRHMIDFSGLVTPEVANQLPTLGTWEASTTWAIQHFWPDYVVLDRLGFPGVAEAGWFRAAYTAMHESANQGTLWMTVYQHTEGP